MTVYEYIKTSRAGRGSEIFYISVLSGRHILQMFMFLQSTYYSDNFDDTHKCVACMYVGVLLPSK